jgi:hypothetical protein
MAVYHQRKKYFEKTRYLFCVINSYDSLQPNDFKSIHIVRDILEICMQLFINNNKKIKEIMPN